MKPANLIYFGTPDFSAQVLESIIQNQSSGVNITGVVTSPDKPIGRKQVLTPSPVALTAGKYHFPVFKPEKLTADNLIHVKLLKPDIFLVVSYGKIIPTTWLSAPSIGTFNLHFSLLPRYRGALCISEAIKNEDHETGVTLMVMDKQLDHGPIISQEKVRIDINDNVATLTNKLTQTGTNLLTNFLPLLAQNKFTSQPQNESAATYTPFTKTRSRLSTFLDWKTVQDALAGKAAPATHALIRSNNPDPGAWTKVPVANRQNSKIKEIELKIIKTKLSSDLRTLTPETVQLPGKPPVGWKNFLAGHEIS